MIIEGDCIEEMKKMEANSIDFLLSDPPYGIGFMGKTWDKFSAKEFQEWTERWATQALRVLKPGAYGFVFSSSRTSHRVGVGLEDAGFEIRDVISWLYLSGFPKGQNISKFIDKYFGLKSLRGKEKVYADGGKASDRKKIGDPLTKSVYSEKGDNLAGEGVVYESIPVSDEAKLWEGYRTCLKPAREDIILIRKPMEGTYTENVLKWGVGGINIDATRIPLNLENEKDNRAHDQSKNYKYTSEHQNAAVDFFGKDGVRQEHINQLYEMKGRYPTNVIIDNMVAELFDMISGISEKSKLIQHKKVNRSKEYEGFFESGFDNKKIDPEGISSYGDSGGMSKFFENVGNWCEPLKTVYGGKGFKRSFEHFNLRDGGGMSKFFYCPKAFSTERELGLEKIKEKVRDTTRNKPIDNPFNRNHKVLNFHPTVKPIKLLCYLIRMIRPPTLNPVLLDPFAGSGSTGIAAKIERCKPILIEKNPEYMEIIKNRMKVDVREFHKFTDSVVPQPDQLSILSFK